MYPDRDLTGMSEQDKKYIDELKNKKSSFKLVKVDNESKDMECYTYDNSEDKNIYIIQRKQLEMN